MPVPIEQHIIRFDIAIRVSISMLCRLSCLVLPVNEAEFVHSFNCESKLRHVEPSDIFRKYFILNKHRHQVTARQEFHEHIQESRVLECRV
jgi:hypothetical protein